MLGQDLVDVLNTCYASGSLSLSQQHGIISLAFKRSDDTSLIVNSDDTILAVFDTYSRFEAASGSKLNVFKSKGFWLGAWNRSDPPVQLEWASEKIKVLGVYMGPGDIEEANWRPRISAVEKVLCLLFWPFAPLLSCLVKCLAGSRRVVFSTLLLFCRWFTFPLSSLSCH